MIEKACALCGAAMSLRAESLPGYQEPARFAILDCSTCVTMVADPCASDQRVYDAIYAVPGGAPGYDRNFQLADGVRNARDPLGFLANRSDAFWAVRKFILENQPRTVLEIGAGLGSLTYAINKAGFRTLGIERSNEAAKRAIDRFGPYYKAISVEQFAIESTQQFDAIVLVEVLEHLEDPLAFVRSALRLLTPKGSMLITTPNRSYFEKDTMWNTDLPPVHLWWFSEHSLLQIGKSVACDVNFVDFKEYSARYPVLISPNTSLSPMFSEAGVQIRKESFPIALLRRLGVLQDTYLLASAIAGRLRLGPRSSSRRPTLAATLSLALR